MAVGDDAISAGYPLVGNIDLVRYGAQEINRTRDFVALVKKLFPSGKGGYRTSSGISSGYGDPSGGDNGDVYFKIVG